MKRSCAIGISLALSLLVPALFAVERPFETGKILSIEKKAHSRVLYYLVNTPVTQDDPYYEVRVQVNGTVYLAEYTPVHAQQTLPEDWQVEGAIQARVEKHNLFLKQPGEVELQLVIVKRMAAAAPSASH